MRGHGWWTLHVRHWFTRVCIKHSDLPISTGRSYELIVMIVAEGKHFPCAVGDAELLL